jgi:hypothetical protein
MKMQAESIAIAEGDYNEDSTSFDERHGGKSARQVGIDNYLEALELDQKLHGKGAGGMPDREKPKEEHTDVNKYLSETYDPDKTTTGEKVYFKDLEYDEQRDVRDWLINKLKSSNPEFSREQISEAVKKAANSLTQADVDKATSDSGESKPITARKPVENVDIYSVASGA